MSRGPRRESLAHDPDDQHESDIQHHPVPEAPSIDPENEDRVEIASDESFPASDAPSWTLGKRKR